MHNNEVQFSRAESQVRAEISGLISKALGKDTEPFLLIIEYPPDSKMGDYSLPFFLLAKQLKKNPVELANLLAEKIKPSGLIAKVIAQGPYLNFFVERNAFSELALVEIFKEKNKYGSSKIGKGKKIMVEFFSPNTNKPLTIGHVRNICLGSSLVQLLRFSGHKVVSSSIYNDRGIAIAKTVLGYQKWSNGKMPKDTGEKSDHFVGKFYVKFAQAEAKDPNLAKEAQRTLRSWEQDDPKARKVWQQLMKWVLDGFKQTLKKLNIESFDEEYYESEFFNEGKKIVGQGLEKGVFKKGDDGEIMAALEQYGLPDKVLLRPDGTSLYITQDLHLAKLKEGFDIDTSIYVVGSEQDIYFKQLFKMLELLESDHHVNYHHLSYGMIRLPDGKIKSREGLAEGTGADELIEQLETMATEEIKSRFKDLSDKEVSKRAEAIAVSALKFYILLVSPKTTMVFDPKKSLAFTGKTGPYLQYTYARISSIFVKAKTKPSSRIDFSILGSDSEFELIKLLAQFPHIINQSIIHYDPSHLAVYLHEISQHFSSFYESTPVLTSSAKEKKARFLLLKDVQTVLSTGLELLGIEPIEKM